MFRPEEQEGHLLRESRCSPPPPLTRISHSLLPSSPPPSPDAASPSSCASSPSSHASLPLASVDLPHTLGWGEGAAHSGVATPDPRTAGPSPGSLPAWLELDWNRTCGTNREGGRIQIKKERQQVVKTNKQKRPDA